MLILISNPIELPGEAALINRCFDEGLDFLHLRKPQASEQDINALIKKIDSKYHSRLSLHQHHHLAGEYGIRRLHFSEQLRQTLQHKTAEELIGKGYQLSTSVHSTDSFRLLADIFSYAFIGPLFNSISKPGYLANGNCSIKDEQRSTKAIAIGGIQVSNIHQLKGSFDGVAILGGVWCSNNPFQEFYQMKKLWNTKDL